MTKDNWLTVAMVIAVIITAMATLFGPVLAVYVQSRISQPKPTPDVNQPNWLRRLAMSPWILIVPAFGILASICGLVLEFLLEFLKPTPLTHWTVLRIAFHIAVINFNFTYIVWLVLWNMVRENEAEQAQTNRGILDILKDLNQRAG